MLDIKSFLWIFCSRMVTWRRSRLYSKGCKNNVIYLSFSRKSRYVYASGFDKTGKSDAVLKYDLEVEPQKRDSEFGGNIFGSEVVFVPSKNANEEDDSYLLYFYVR
ncbi:hypothetical protein Leryth_018136 [Lithospermum erythrorhizon]|nr:hypothetical protein Leryth_018136 [Lithospermum erythrorhizon]